jgi:DivIVA domain-containing protein
MDSDLNLPLLPSAEQIRRREFATVRRGYDPDQVRDYLLAVAQQVETLEKELRELRKTGFALADRSSEGLMPSAAGDPYEEVAKRLAGVLGNADREAIRILDESKVQSGTILERARTEADRIRVDAQAKAEAARLEGNEVLSQAKAEADRILSGLAERRRTLLSQLKEMRTRLLTVAAELRLDDEVAEAIPPAMASPSNEVPQEKPDSAWVSRGTVDIPDLALSERDHEDDAEA